MRTTHADVAHESLEQRFLSDITHNCNNVIVLERMHALQLALVAGCLFQTTWNLKNDNAPYSLTELYDGVLRPMRFVITEIYSILRREAIGRDGLGCASSLKLL